MVVSNPPYVAADDALPAEVADWEPRGALVAGPTGLEAIERIVAGAPGWLAPTARSSSRSARPRARPSSPWPAAAGFAEVEVRPDHNRRDRALVARLWTLLDALGRVHDGRPGVAK